MRKRALLFALTALGILLSASRADDWMFRDGPYTVDPKSGNRVEQYQQPVQPVQDSYKKFFETDHPYIPYEYYWDEEGIPGEPGYIDVPYGGSSPGYGGMGFQNF